MRIIECHIENFGKLSDKTYTFTDGLNVINEKNGTGKSTLATFIKVMFFGFANEGKRNDIENERKRFKPWQGGVYGGQITFEIEEKIYKVMRTFGAKDKDDEFVLYDQVTMLESNDYSSKIGEELLRIDHDSFCRTVYIAGGDCDTSATDSINAKLGNLAENTDDINNYENVRKTLANLMNSMSPRRKTGDIYKLNNEIGSLRESIRSAEEIDKSIANLTNRLNEDKTRRCELEINQNEIQNKLNKISSFKDIQAKRNKYDDLCGQYIARKNKYDEELEYFPAGLPDEEELVKYISDASKLYSYKSHIENYSISDAESAELIELDNLLKDNLPDSEFDSLINIWSKRTEKKNFISTKRASLSTLEDVAKHNSSINSKRENNSVNRSKNNSQVAIIAGILLALVGIIGFSVNAILGVAGIVAGAITLIFGVLVKKNSGQEYKEKTIQDLNESIPENEELKDLRSEIESDEEFIKQTENEIRAFFERYKLVYDEANVQNSLTELKNNIQKYKELLSRNQKLNNAESAYNKLSDGVTNFIKGLSICPKEPFQEQLQDIREHLRRCRDSKLELDRVKEQKEAFEAANDVSAINNIKIEESFESLEELNENLKLVTEQLGRTIENISDYNSRLDKAYSDREEVSDDEVKLSESEEHVSVMMRKYNLITKTQEYLEKAKESFTARYMSPIMNGFEKYYKLLTQEDALNYQINAKIEVAATEVGMLRNIKLLSMGYQSLIGICMRMALVDAMYSGEKPFIVFDDPFVNLDEDKVRGGLDFLDSISKEYQVIYFTCHESRV